MLFGVPMNVFHRVLAVSPTTMAQEGQNILLVESEIAHQRSSFALDIGKHGSLTIAHVITQWLGTVYTTNTTANQCGSSKDKTPACISTTDEVLHFGMLWYTYIFCLRLLMQ